jgi:alcohol dehydrogenase (cytochrome c)
MNKQVFAFAILLATCAPSFAQTGPTGTWRVEGAGPQFPWEAVLRADGSNLIGAVSSCASVTRAFEIFEGRIDGNTITFKCKSGDGQRTITLTGRINGDEIAFTWELQVQDGGNRAATDGMFGDSAPPRFAAKRVPDAADAVAETAAHVRKTPAVTFDRILHADQEPQNWLTYSGTVFGQRYSPLTKITPSNVKNLELSWLWQVRSSQKFEATPLVVDGVLYTVEAPNDVVALDAVTGRLLWTYPYTPKGGYGVCCGAVNRGLAILGGTLFMGTVDAHLLAINAYSGKLIWNTTVANATDPACNRSDTRLFLICYSITHAPLVVKDKVIVGTAGGDGSIRGFIAAFDVSTGKEVWRFYTVPAPGEPGNETWSGDAWKTGGAAVWNTGSYDPALNLTYWGTGNPSSFSYTYQGQTGLGDNLYSDSVVALDADTGKLRWHYQFTPHDDRDWDAAQVPVLADIQWQGRPRKVMLQATKNGLWYVLDRLTGQFLMGKPFVEVNWMSGFDEKGRPVRTPKSSNSDTPVLPQFVGTNWYPPSYSPSTGIFYIPSSSANAIRAFDPQTGEKKWEFKRNDAVFTAGALTTASGVLFTGAGRYFYALDARTGELLWQMALTGNVESGPMSYSVGGTQYIAVAAGNTLFTFALRQ